MRNSSNKLKIAFLVLFGIIILSYTLFQSQKLLSGPVVKIISPQNGQTFNQALILIEGTAKNISRINLNDRQIYTDNNGYFKEKFLLSSGYNVIKIDAVDKFKKYTENRLELILKEY
ncbi:MAG: hypothetical protein WAX44_01040 [Minisyncoccia bacterium]